MCKNCYSQPQYEGNMTCRYLKCNNCGERWPTGAVISVMNADCCRKPNIHVYKDDYGSSMKSSSASGEVASGSSDKQPG